MYICIYIYIPRALAGDVYLAIPALVLAGCRCAPSVRAPRAAAQREAHRTGGDAPWTWSDAPSGWIEPTLQEHMEGAR